MVRRERKRFFNPYSPYRGKSRGRRTALWIAGGILAVLVLLLAFCFVNHRICLCREGKLLTPPGNLVDIGGQRMHVYTEGSGPATVVFLAGGGTCSPVLDFKSLYSLVGGNYQIAVVEKFGYGFSDCSDRSRDIDTILSDTRAALAGSGLDGPYILCPHSMSGLEALRWAQLYPEEVLAIAGLDMAVPEAYREMDISLPALRLGQFAVRSGIARLLPGLAEGEAVHNGTLTEAEKAQYRALFYRSTATEDMLAEAAAVKGNAETVAGSALPQVPMLLFASDGSGGTGFSEKVWRGFQRDFLAGAENARLVELDCPHYVHDYEYVRISMELKAWIESLDG